MAAAPTMLHPDLLGPYDPYGMLRDGGRLVRLTIPEKIQSELFEIVEIQPAGFSFRSRERSTEFSSELQ